MGKGYNKRKRAMKAMFLNQAQKEIDRLYKENELLKNDPNSVVGQFLGKFQDTVQQNNRLSALTATLIKMAGDKVVVLKADIEAWKDCRLQIKVETPEGIESFEEATELIFTYEKLPLEQQQPAPVAEPEIPECTDPTCTLPKDFKHLHDAPAPEGDPSVKPPDSDGSNENEVQASEPQIVPTELVNLTLASSPQDTTDGDAPTQVAGEGGEVGETVPVEGLPEGGLI